jgi:hypothetical protein
VKPLLNPETFFPRNVDTERQHNQVSVEGFLFGALSANLCPPILFRVKILLTIIKVDAKWFILWGALVVMLNIPYPAMFRLSEKVPSCPEVALSTLRIIIILFLKN